MAVPMAGTRESIGEQYYGRHHLMTTRSTDPAAKQRTREIFKAIMKEKREDAIGWEAILETAAPSDWFAEYPSPKAGESPHDSKWTKIHAMHHAASLGCLWAMEDMKGVLGQTEERLQQLVDTMSIMYKETPTASQQDTEEHYTPLMSAVYMGEVKAAIWLLDHDASANTPNRDGHTPLHFVAWHGLTHQGSDVRVGTIKQIVVKLVQKQADIMARTPRNDAAWAVHIQCKTPFQIALQPQHRYPKEALHLLTTFYHHPATGRLLHDVSDAAEVNPNAAELLVRQLRSLDTTKVRSQLRKEVQDLLEKQEKAEKASLVSRPDGQKNVHLQIFVEILRRSPMAAVMLLDFLIVEPRLTDPQRYPLPLYTELPNNVVSATYQRSASADGQPFWGKARPLKCQAEISSGVPCSGVLTDVYRAHGYCHACRIVRHTVLSCPKCPRDIAWSLCEDCERQKLLETRREKGDQEDREPLWHNIFKKTLPEDPLTHRNVYEVLVRVLYMPGVLTFEVLKIIAMIKLQDPHHRRIFSEVSINAIIDCMWQQLYPSFTVNFGRQMMLLFVLLLVGVDPGLLQTPGWSVLFYSVVFECFVMSALNIGWGLYLSSQWEGERARSSVGASPRFGSRATSSCFEQARGVGRMLSRQWTTHDSLGSLSPVAGPARRRWCERFLNHSQVSFLNMFTLRDCTNIAGLSVLLYGVGIVSDAGATDLGFTKVLIASNALIQCFGTMATLCVSSTVGPLILAVLHSFVPMRGMFLLMGMLFATFSSAFIILRDPDRSVYFVLIYLFQGLVLADRDTEETISGLDMAREQTLDFKQQLFTGGGDEWTLQFTLLLAVGASSVFSLVLLNLTIGMYTKFYDQIEPEADKLVRQARLKRCVSVMLHPAWSICQLKFLSNWKFRPLLCVVVVVYALSVLLNSLLIACLALPTATLLLRVLIMLNTADIGERNHFLWMTFPADYQQDEKEQHAREMESFAKRLAEDHADLRQRVLELTRTVRELAAQRPALADPPREAPSGSADVR